MCIMRWQVTYMSIALRLLKINYSQYIFHYIEKSISMIRVTVARGSMYTNLQFFRQPGIIYNHLLLIIIYQDV